MLIHYRELLAMSAMCYQKMVLVPGLFFIANEDNDLH